MAKKRKPGRPPKPDGEKFEVISVSLPPHHVVWLDTQQQGRSPAVQGLIEAELRRERRRKEKA